MTVSFQKPNSWIMWYDKVVLFGKSDITDEKLMDCVIRNLLVHEANFSNYIFINVYI